MNAGIAFFPTAHYNEHILDIWSYMLGPHLITTVNQRVLGFLARFSGKAFYERQIARKLDIAFGSANRSLNELYSSKAIKRRGEGKMFFYSIDMSNAAVVEYKKLVNLALIEPLVEELKEMATRVILYGSCAQGTDTSRSDFDLFIVTNCKQDAMVILNRFVLPKGYEELVVRPVIKTPVELLEAGDSEKAFIAEVERGITLWERKAVESGVYAMP